MKRKIIVPIVCLFVLLIVFGTLQACAQKEFDPSVVPDGMLFY